ncbi:TlpA family protein disulfide reductase [Cellulomonas edaphi]|uniref:TlpA disulfide reductase family protein n=1 Tax=Cellulomonas edaphi TaxID=3053468 RepID=A0ABT7S9D5_9CELL|nr:TlpA disulfide reductase family protein [Cellulomons edaphi]MDM7832238.1 TlpA disulfide reductase family protein [Cellulomons edaphi]
MRARILAAAVLTAGLAAGVLAGCSDDGQGSNDVSNQGFVSSDGAVKTWPAGDRKGPVALQGTDFAGKQQDVADWLGDVVVVNTWYANCPPCRAEASDLVGVANDYANQGVHVIGLNGTDEAADADAFARKYDVPYPSIKDNTGAAVAALQGVVPINAVPTTVVLDREGKVGARILGIADASTLRGVIDDLLAESA